MELWKAAPSQWMNVPVLIGVLYKAAAFCGVLYLLLAYTPAGGLWADLLQSYELSVSLTPVNLCLSLACGYVFLAMLYAVLDVMFTSYVISDERLFYTRGVFSRYSDQIELYRVKDRSTDQPFLLRLIGLGHVILMTSDKTHPTFKIEGVRDVLYISDLLRDCVEKQRREKGVREFD
jgi:uncharacterized membrane protein YdbT with pleckstrin-like domain